MDRLVACQEAAIAVRIEASIDYVVTSYPPLPVLLDQLVGDVGGRAYGRQRLALHYEQHRPHVACSPSPSTMWFVLMWRLRVPSIAKMAGEIRAHPVVPWGRGEVAVDVAVGGVQLDRAFHVAVVGESVVARDQVEDRQSVVSGQCHLVLRTV
jgi:hypothetical protein